MRISIKEKKDNTDKIIRDLRRFTSEKVVVGIINPEIAEYGAYNEFGTKDIPERSFLRSTYDEKIAKWQRQIQATIRKILRMESDGSNALTQLGEVAVKDVQRKISSNIAPPNAPSTIAKKGAGKTTLYDTGKLTRAITYEGRPR